MYRIRFRQAELLATTGCIAGLSTERRASGVHTVLPRFSFPMTDLLSTAHLCAPDDPDHPYASWPSLGSNPLGRLAILTPELTSTAAQEIKTGKRFALDHPVYPSGALLNGRVGASHHVVRVGPTPGSREEAEAQGQTYQPMFDDIVQFNTQASTQWDYFMHYSYPGSGEFYGGLSAEDVQAHRTGEIGVGGGCPAPIITNADRD